ncbi:YdcF family protein [Acidovorax sp. sic0104]|uniref:YdcF family protein n=1 Tax=Acidovorax sp. sic0104 TaxID=2854784 RepID=UPI0021064A60|nr:YdcF family protein [Acidovorax sp. sic0104]
MARVACAVTAPILLADGLALMAMGLFSMGVTVPAALGFALGLLAWRWHPVKHWMAKAPWRQRAWRAGWVALGLWLASVAVFWGVILQQSRALHSEAGGIVAPAAIIVLGSGTPHGKPSPALRARLDKGRELAEQHPGAWVLVSGGVDFGETLSEGQVMGDYLRAQGLPAERILQEERSTSTELNLRYSLPLLEAQGLGLGAPVAVVTSDFHTVRALRIARRIGYTQAFTAAASTPLYLRYNAWLREYFAFASSWALGEV